MKELSSERAVKISALFDKLRMKIDAKLDEYLPPEDAPPEPIHRAMRYSVFAGGKRLRPILTLLAAEACSGTYEQALPAACAVEMIHTYSLIHDDLPAMDDDDLRRGKPTSHKVFGEAAAILAGDALLTMAFETIARGAAKKRVAAALVEELARAAGSSGMVGGQVMDLAGERAVPDAEFLQKTHLLKTAALMRASLSLGAISSEASKKKVKALGAFGEKLGLAFQIVDDIMDVESSPDQLGKAVHKDGRMGKMTYPGVFGIERSKSEAEKATAEALRCLENFDGDVRNLKDAAVYMLARKK